MKECHGDRHGRRHAGAAIERCARVTLVHSFVRFPILSTYEVERLLTAQEINTHSSAPLRSFSMAYTPGA